MRYIIRGFLLTGAFLLVMSCATKQPVLYKDDRPLHLSEYQKMAQKKYEEERFREAIPIYRAVIKNYPENSSAVAWAHYEIGFCYYRMENYDQAMVYFRKVVNEYNEPAATKLAEHMMSKISEKKNQK
ncbi:MAG: tetratricopeptide repeat protein [Spirochaetota bacterium]